MHSKSLAQFSLFATGKYPASRAVGRARRWQLLRAAENNAPRRKEKTKAVHLIKILHNLTFFNLKSKIDMTYCLNRECQQPENPNTAKLCLNCGYHLLLRQRYRPTQLLGKGRFGKTFLAADLRKRRGRLYPILQSGKLADIQLCYCFRTT
ncbi:4-Cys prefix domain-containing protein [Microcoleus sp. B4-D4]|uniref:4-Cys prefix domain-containing protein n=1 Tax=Microcoleus sp. B4-D4 TaxID=2818667 RepID=UPI002FD278CE